MKKESKLLRCRERVGEWDTKANGPVQTTWLIPHNTRKMVTETVVMPQESLEVVGDDIYIYWEKLAEFIIFHLIEIYGFGANNFYI